MFMPTTQRAPFKPAPARVPAAGCCGRGAPRRAARRLLRGSQARVGPFPRDRGPAAMFKRPALSQGAVEDVIRSGSAAWSVRSPDGCEIGDEVILTSSSVCLRGPRRKIAGPGVPPAQLTKCYSSGALEVESTENIRAISGTWSLSRWRRYTPDGSMPEDDVSNPPGARAV